MRLRAFIALATGTTLLLTAVTIGDARQSSSVVIPGSARLISVAMPKGTGALAGLVLDGRSDRPVPDAIVTIEWQGTILRALTDAHGRFAFADLPPGSFSLTATLGGYSPGALGRLRPGGPFQTVILRDGERRADLSIPIWPLAVVEGMVADDRGEPIVGVTVRAYRRSYERGRAALTAGPDDATDDRGVFRIPSLDPGEYVIGVPMTTYAWPASLENHMLLGGEHPPGITASAVGQLASLFGSGIQLSGAASLVVQTADRSSPAMPAGDGHVAVYPAQFFAGAAAAADAAVLSLRSGDQRVDVRFTLRLERGQNVSGVVTSGSGAADDLVVRLSPAGAADTTAPIDTAVAVTDARGRFTFVGVPPGQYVLRAARLPRGELAAPSSATVVVVGGTTVRQPAERPLPREAMQWAEAPVTVGDRDVDDMRVTLRSGVRVRGRAEFRGTRPQPSAEAIARIRVELEPADDRTAALTPRPVRGRIETDLQFATLAAPAGRYRMSVSGLPEGWALHAATAGSRDGSLDPVDLEAAEIRGVTLVFTDRPSGVSGTVSGSGGARDPAAAVVVFPADRSANRAESRRLVRYVRVDRAGSFVASGLPAGRYLIAAIPDAMAAGWQAPAFLESLSRVATRVEITDGMTSQVTLRTVRPDVR